jgi:RND superfamily putative drug exporter
MSWLGRVAGWVSGRRTKWVVLVFWLLLVGVAGPLAGKLTSAEKNDNSAWLPANAEATQVVELQKRFQSADVAPAVIVYERPSGITPADQAKAAADTRAFGDIDAAAGDVVGPIPAADGKALQVVVQVGSEEGWDTIATAVDQIRGVTGTGQDGLSVYVAGPAGVAADTAEAFEGVDGTLLYTTVIVVIVILLVTYRSPVLWLLPVISAGIALISAQAVIYLLAEYAGLLVNGQSAAILTVLVFGAGTDYALLLVARYREELRRHQDRHEAMALALRRAGPAIIASAATVAIGMLCLFLAEMNSTKGLGPVAAFGIVIGLLAMITLLPALLVICGRWLFWPVRPRFGSPEPTAHGVWARLGRGVARRPRVVWVTTALVLGAMALGLTQLNAAGLSTGDTFIDKPESVVGQEVLGRHFAAGQGQPVVVIGKAQAGPQLQAALAGTDGITEVSPPVVKDGYIHLEGTLQDQPDSQAAEATVDRVRAAAHAVSGADAKVGGMTALTLDMNRANSHDNKLIIPLVLLVVLLILGVLLRAIVVPLILVATVVLSFAAALGISAVLFEHVFGFAGTDTAFPLFVFVFLVALGIDYNIFLMTRVREESQSFGTQRGALIGLAATGGVITSAGLVLAGTFAALASLPVVAFAEIGVAVALGVLLDTLVVRSVLVTALSLELGRWMWWPSRLSAKRERSLSEPESEHEPALVS